jgi:molybdopterin molybdotransferase
MKPLKRLIQMSDAKTLIRKEARLVDRTEDVRITEASGRVCAEEVVSRANVPPFSRSVMDGYAVKAADTRSASKLRPVRLRPIEILYAGSVPKKSVRKGECTQIATGAMIPRGADAVVMVEDTERRDKAILVYGAVRPGHNVSKMGEDIGKGARILSEHEVLNPSKLGALAAIGRDHVRVYSKPLVAMAVTGDEIAALSSNLELGQVYNINAYTLSALLESGGAEVRVLDVAGDSIKDLVKVLDDNRDCDIVVFSGGSSVGERDVVLDALEQRGRVVFHGVAIKPGKPTLFGVVGHQLVFGMPGNPTACLSNGYLLLVPLVRQIARLPQSPQRQVAARMSKRIVSAKGRTEFLTVKLKGDVAHPAFKKSGAITSMAYADGYVVVPADVDHLEKEESVTVYLL